MRSYPLLVASKDQSHVADRLMEDIGEIRWISETLSTIAGISVYVCRFQKLKEKVVDSTGIATSSQR